MLNFSHNKKGKSMENLIEEFKLNVKVEENK